VGDFPCLEEHVRCTRGAREFPTENTGCPVSTSRQILFQAHILMADWNCCQYQSTNCENFRVLRKNGELHRLCKFHRDRANETQRRWHSRRKDAAPILVPSKHPPVFKGRAPARLKAAASDEPCRATPSRRCEGSIRSSRVKTEASVPEMQRDYECSSWGFDAKLSDHEIETLTALVLEYNATPST
jgi:hypothetical protein